MRVLVVGALGKGALEHSYISAAKELGHEIVTFDPAQEQAQYIIGGKIGKKLHAFLPVEQWIRKMNRKLVVKARAFNPELILLFTNARVLPGTLACIKTILPVCKIAWIWPDTPLNLEKHNFINARLVDITATYSSASKPVFEKLGFTNVQWVPLAADPGMHGRNQPSSNFSADIGFVGGWRPEREKVMAVLFDAFPELKFAIHGPYWKRECKHEGLRKLILSDGLYESSLADFFNSTRINVNIIDDTNFPAANMRFFEVPVAGGLQLSSPCPEQDKIFLQHEHAVYFSDDSSLIQEVKWIIDNPVRAATIRRNAMELVASAHTYKSRLSTIINQLF